MRGNCHVRFLGEGDGATQAPLPDKHKTDGRNILIYTIQALSGGRGKGALQQEQIKPSGLAITVKTHQTHIDQVRIVPRNGFYVVEIIYTKEVTPASMNAASYAGIDIGMDNLAALTSNHPGFAPVLVNGRPVKSVNQYYNKRKAELQSKLGRTGTTKRMERLTNTRNLRIDHYLHTASRWIVDDLVAHGIGTLVIGKNDGWKQEANMGKRTNQNFVSIPHARFIQMIQYKAELAGITVIITEESYTSKASFLDRDEMPVYDPNRTEKSKFSGKRIERGLYRAKDGTLINADCNGSSNIIRKVAPNAFQQAEGVEDGKRVVPLVVHPVRLSFPSRSQKVSKSVSKQTRECEKTLCFARLFWNYANNTVFFTEDNREEVFSMQSKPGQHNKQLGEPALSSARMQAIREAARRVTLELLQKQQSAQTPISQAQEPASNEGQAVEANPTQGTVEKPKTRLLAAIQPVLEVVADSALRQSDSERLQL